MRFDLKVKYFLVKVLAILAIYFFMVSASQIDMPKTDYEVLIKNFVISISLIFASYKLYNY